MLDISVIILTYNENLHIQRVIDNVKGFAKHIFVVDSFSTDNTVSLAQQNGAQVYQNPWNNNYATQFNWALENVPIKTEWVLRLDADEYLLPELIEEIHQKLNQLSSDHTGVVFNRRHVFMGKWVKRGTYPVKLLRLFRYKKAKCEQRWMDEHIQLLEGKSIEFKNDFVDHNINNLSWWIAKHNNYSIREAIDLLDLKLNLTQAKNEISGLSKQAAQKRHNKYFYAQSPLFWRSFAYFIYRYIFKFGFLEGKEGFLWHFLQGLWYRSLVDAKIWEITKQCGSDKNKIKAYIQKYYAIEIC